LPAEFLHTWEQRGIKVADTAHRTLGLWAFDSVNANAFLPALDYLRCSSADAVAIQETKIPDEHTLRTSESTARTAKWNLSIAPCFHTAAGGNSAGVAVGTRSCIGLALTNIPQEVFTCLHDAAPHAAFRHRFTLRHMGAVMRGGLHIGSAYMHTTIGAAAGPNLDLLHSIAAALA
jgi:hypothetical protein